MSGTRRRGNPAFFAPSNEHPFTDAQASSAKLPQPKGKAGAVVAHKRRPSKAQLLPGIVAGEKVWLHVPASKESETALKRRIMVALAASGALAWNNPVGVTKLRSGQWNRYGLCVGSADLVGLVRMPSGIGRFFGCEVKTPKGVISDEQERWAKVVRRWGGYVCFARSVEDALEGLRECREGVLQ